MFRQIKWKNYKTKTKYNNKFTDFNGERYQSKFEAKVAEELHYRKLAGEIKEIKRQVKISLDVNGIHICNYYIDFVIERVDGITEYIEAKGMITESWRLKWRLFEALYKDVPNIELSVIYNK